MSCDCRLLSILLPPRPSALSDLPCRPPLTRDGAQTQPSCRNISLSRLLWAPAQIELVSGAGDGGEVSQLGEGFPEGSGAVKRARGGAQALGTPVIHEDTPPYPEGGVEA